MKKFLLSLILLSAMPVYAFEDCLISTNGKLTDISIEHNDIVDVCPIVTICPIVIICPAVAEPYCTQKCRS